MGILLWFCTKQYPSFNHRRDSSYSGSICKCANILCSSNSGKPNRFRNSYQMVCSRYWWRCFSSRCCISFWKLLCFSNFKWFWKFKNSGCCNNSSITSKCRNKRKFKNLCRYKRKWVLIICSFRRNTCYRWNLVSYNGWSRNVYLYSSSDFPLYNS